MAFAEYGDAGFGIFGRALQGVKCGAHEVNIMRAGNAASHKADALARQDLRAAADR